MSGKKPIITINRIFMAPTLGIPKQILDENNCLNAYERDEMRDIQYDDAVYLLFRPKNMDKFREFLDGEYERTKTIIEDYDYPNGFVVVVYTLDPELKEDFDTVRQGKYSKTSQKFQDKLPKSIKITTEDGLRRDQLSLQTQIFRKTKNLREHWEEKFGADLPDDAEVWDGYFIKQETLTEKILKQYESETVVRDLS